MLAGETFIAGRIPNERIATQKEVANSAAITTVETTVSSVTAALVTGRTYRLTFDGQFTQSVAGDVFEVRFREDSSVGTSIHFRRHAPGSTAGGISYHMEVEYVAVATGNKTFVITLIRGSGTGNIILAASTGGTYLYVDYIRG